MKKENFVVLKKCGKPVLYTKASDNDIENIVRKFVFCNTGISHSPLKAFEEIKKESFKDFEIKEMKISDLLDSDFPVDIWWEKNYQELMEFLVDKKKEKKELEEILVDDSILEFLGLVMH